MDLQALFETSRAKIMHSEKRWIINARLQATKECAQNRHTGLSQHLNSQGFSSEPIKTFLRKTNGSFI